MSTKRPLSSRQTTMPVKNRVLAPAPSKVTAEQPDKPKTGFFDLPGELRNQIYILALEDVAIHILPIKTEESRRAPHALTRTSKQVRQEVQPMIWSICPISCNVTDFGFEGLLEWLRRITPDRRSHLRNNKRLTIVLHTTSQTVPKTLDSLRKWLHFRADPCQAHADWQYSGPKPPEKICADLRRRAKRMPEEGKRTEMNAMLEALDIPRQMARPASRRTQS